MMSPGDRVKDIRLSVIFRKPPVHEGMVIATYGGFVLVLWNDLGLELVSEDDVRPIEAK